MTGPIDRDDADFDNAWERAQNAATEHRAPLTPGLEITENDPEYVMLYEDLQGSQLSWRYLVEEMTEDKLYWLAGHLEQAPPGIEPTRWSKLQQNAWRARAAAARRESDRSIRAQLDFQAGENERNRESAERTTGTMSAYQRDDNARSLALTKHLADSQQEFQRKENLSSRWMAFLGSLIGVGGVALGVWLGQSDPPPDPLRVQVIEPTPVSSAAPPKTPSTTTSSSTTTTASPGTTAN